MVLPEYRCSSYFTLDAADHTCTFIGFNAPGENEDWEDVALLQWEAWKKDNGR